MDRWPAIFRKSKDCFSFITIDLKKPKELVKEPSPQSFGSFTSSSIKPVSFFENFQKPKTRIYFRNLSKTLNHRSFDFNFFQKARAVIKKRNQINKLFFNFWLLIFLNKKQYLVCVNQQRIIGCFQIFENWYCENQCQLIPLPSVKILEKKIWGKTGPFCKLFF